MKREEKIFEEARDVISDGQEEIPQERKVVYDKKTKQFSIKIPKSLALKTELKKDSNFDIIFNLNKEETKQKINKSKLVIYLKEDERKKDT